MLARRRGRGCGWRATTWLAVAVPTAATLAFLAAAGPSATAWAGEGGDAAEGAASDTVLRDALVAAVMQPAARLEIVAVDRPASSTCVTTGPEAHAETSRPIEGSGRVAVKLVGRRAGGGPCELWVWARVRVFAKVPVLRRAVRMGEALAPAVDLLERELTAGRRPASFEALVSGKGVATRPFGAGQLVEQGGVSAPGPRAGDNIKILVVSGALAVEETGRVVPCARGMTCAVTPSGKHVEGNFVDGRLLVELP